MSDPDFVKIILIFLSLMMIDPRRPSFEYADLPLIQIILENTFCLTNFYSYKNREHH